MSILIKLRENKDFTENEEYIAKYIIKNFRNIRLTIKSQEVK